jgi:hypothetical protein
VIGLVGLIGLAADSWRTVALAVILLQGTVLLVVLDIHRRLDIAARQATRQIDAIDRRIDNVSARVVTESQSLATQVRARFSADDDS